MSTKLRSVQSPSPVSGSGVRFWHRSLHRFSPLWRTFHQMHHSSERLDIASAFWFSQPDMVIWTRLPSVAIDRPECLIGLEHVRIRGARLTIYPKAGHAVHSEGPQCFALDLAAFAADLAQQPARTFT